MMKFKFAPAIILISILSVSCMERGYNYVPSSQYIPALKEKGEVNLNASLREINGAYALSDRLYLHSQVMYNISKISSFSLLNFAPPKSGVHQTFYSQLWVGYYKNYNEILGLQCSVSSGLGRSRNETELDIGEKNIEYVNKEFYLKNNLQGSIIFSSKRYGSAFGFSNRLSSYMPLKTTNRKTVNGVPKESYLLEEYSQGNHWFYEPAVFLRAVKKKLKYEIQMSMPFVLGDDFTDLSSSSLVKPSKLSLSLSYTFSTISKTVRKNN